MAYAHDGARFRPLTGGLATFCVAALLLAGCAKSDQPPSQNSGPSNTEAQVAKRIMGPKDAPNPKSGGKVVFGIEAETYGMDPTRIPLAVSGHLIASAIYDPLVTIDENGKTVPFLAESIDGSPDFKTWTIKVRDGVMFHNGKPCDAAAIKANIEANRNSLVARLAIATIDAVEQPDNKTVVVKLSEPWANWPEILGSQVGYIQEPSMFQTTDSPPIGTGPFKFDSRQVDVSWTLKKNTSYWRKDAKGNQLPYLDELEFRPIPDDAVRLADLDKGNIDLMHTNKPTQILSLRTADNYKRVEFSDGEKDFVVLNTEKAPFDNANARNAIAYATDYERWRNEINKGVKPKATGPWSPGNLGYEEDTGFPTYDLAKAKSFVEAYTKETGQPLEFTYLAREDVANMADAQQLKAMWEQAGMKVTLQTYAQIQLIAHVATGDYQLSEWRLFGESSGGDTVWIRSTSIMPPPGVSLNFARYRNPELDTAISAAIATDDQGKRSDELKKVARILAKNVPIIWLGRTDWIMAGSPKVNGFYASANGTIQTLGPKTWIGELYKS